MKRRTYLPIIALLALSAAASAELPTEEHERRLQAGREALNASRFEKAIEVLTPAAQDMNPKAMLALSKAHFMYATRTPEDSPARKHAFESAVRWMVNARENGAKPSAFHQASTAVYLASYPNRFVVHAGGTPLWATQDGQQPLQELQAGAMVQVLERDGDWSSVLTWGKGFRTHGWVRQSELTRASPDLFGAPFRFLVRSDSEALAKQRGYELYHESEDKTVQLYDIKNHGRVSGKFAVEAMPYSLGRVAEVRLDEFTAPRRIALTRAREFKNKFGPPDEVQADNPSKQYWRWHRYGTRIQVLYYPEFSRLELSYRNTPVADALEQFRQNNKENQ